VELVNAYWNFAQGYYGDPGGGKSTLTIDLAARLSTNSPAPDGTTLPELAGAGGNDALWGNGGTDLLSGGSGYDAPLEEPPKEPKVNRCAASSPNSFRSDVAALCRSW
jgi:hypothetical protein